jgi:hypothetical protein
MDVMFHFSPVCVRVLEGTGSSFLLPQEARERERRAMKRYFTVFIVFRIFR